MVNIPLELGDANRYLMVAVESVTDIFIDYAKESAEESACAWKHSTADTTLLNSMCCLIYVSAAALTLTASIQT
jgi:hypothetical protein